MMKGQLAGVMQQKLGQLDRSAAHYTVAIQLNPKASEARSNVGLIYYMLSQTSKAREQWNAAIQLGSTYAPDRIGLLIFDGKLIEARTQLQEYTQKSADDEDGWLMLGDVLRAGRRIGQVESEEASSPLEAPLSGEVLEVNAEALENPDLINSDPYASGWLLRIRLEDPDELEDLISEEEYAELTTEV